MVLEAVRWRRIIRLHIHFVIRPDDVHFYDSTGLGIMTEEAPGMVGLSLGLGLGPVLLIRTYCHYFPSARVD